MSDSSSASGSRPGQSADEVRLAELLAALSVATDLGMGHEPEKAVRACLLATHLARAMDLPEAVVSDVYYVTLLQHLGCTAPAHETTALFGDDVTVLRVAESTDPRSRREALGLLAAAGRGAGPGRVRHLARALFATAEDTRRILLSICEVGPRLAERLGLGEGVQRALLHNVESWDGKDGPLGLSGDDIALPARVAVVATQAIIFDRLGGPDAASAMVQRRSGGWFDPDVAEAFLRVGPDALRAHADVDVWEEVRSAEPVPPRRVPTGHLDAVAAAFGEMADLKTPFTLGHSAQVGDLAARAAVALGLGDAASHCLRRAGHLHDLGRVAVPNAAWERPRALTTGQWEQVRLHAYHSERILTRSTVLEPLARIAGRHHERLDGSGYHRGSSGAEVPVEARVLAAADALQAMTQLRPHRQALAPDEAAASLQASATRGLYDPECARAVVEAAGLRPTRVRAEWPAGLSDREVEVLRLVARGMSNREIAETLVISPRTAEHHVQHVYAKIGVSTRAAAALFAMEHALLR